MVFIFYVFFSAAVLRAIAAVSSRAKSASVMSGLT